MGVQDAAGEGGVDRLAEHGAEPGHGHHVDGAVAEGLGHRRGVAVAVEGRSEATEGGPVDQDGGNVGGPGDLEGATGAVHQHQANGQAVGDDGLQDGAAPRGEDPDPHRRAGDVRSGVLMAGADRSSVSERVRSGVSRCAGDHGRTISAPQSAQPRAARDPPGSVRRSGATVTNLGPGRRGPTGLPPVHGPTSLGPPCPGSAPRDSGIGTHTAFPKRKFRRFRRSRVIGSTGSVHPAREGRAPAGTTGRTPLALLRTPGGAGGLRPGPPGSGERRRTGPTGGSRRRPAPARRSPACGPPWPRRPR